jgi:hypothetical protein
MFTRAADGTLEKEILSHIGLGKHNEKATMISPLETLMRSVLIN